VSFFIALHHRWAGKSRACCTLLGSLIVKRRNPHIFTPGCPQVICGRGLSIPRQNPGVAVLEGYSWDLINLCPEIGDVLLLIRCGSAKPVTALSSL